MCPLSSAPCLARSRSRVLILNITCSVQNVRARAAAYARDKDLAVRSLWPSWMRSVSVGRLRGEPYPVLARGCEGSLVLQSCGMHPDRAVHVVARPASATPRPCAGWTRVRRAPCVGCCRARPGSAIAPGSSTSRRRSRGRCALAPDLRADARSAGSTGLLWIRKAASAALSWM